MGELTASAFTFPVLVDNDWSNWTAWGNGIWPSVYLIDKRGNLRYWWYGELNWQEAFQPCRNQGARHFRRNSRVLVSQSQEGNSVADRTPGNAPQRSNVATNRTAPRDRAGRSRRRNR